MTTFFQAFKFNKKIYLAELIFIGLLLLSLFAWITLMEARHDIFFEGSPVVAGATDDEIVVMIKDFQIFTVFLFGSTIILFLINLFSFCMTRMMIWRGRGLKKLIYLKLLWFLLWSPLYIIFMIALFMFTSAMQTNASLLLASTIVVFANILLYLFSAYFGYFMYSHYFKTHTIVDSLFYGIKKGLKSLPKYIFPLILTLLLLTLSMYVVALLQFNVVTKILAFLVIVYLFHGIEKFFVYSTRLQ